MQLNNITYSYNKNSNLIDNLTVDLTDKNKVLIKGSNGSGKSTLMKIILGLIKPTSGVIKNKKKLAYVPDSSEKYFVGLTANIYFDFLKNEVPILTENFDEKLNYLLKNLNFPEKLLNSTINSLSLGEKKKIMIIGAFLINAETICMDEPLSGLDKDSINNLIKLIDIQVTERNIRFIIISHDDINIFKKADQIIYLD